MDDYVKAENIDTFGAAAYEDLEHLDYEDVQKQFESVKRKRKREQREYQPRVEDFFATRYQYILFSVLMANDSSFIQYLFTQSLFVSGGGFLIIYIITTVFIGIPLIYVEIFLGRYTKRSSSQMYRMAPLFLGFCVSVLVINMVHQAKQASEYSRFIAQFVDIIGDKGRFDHCDDEVSTKMCYDYKTKGPIKEHCVQTYMGMNCTTLGEIAYPYQYAYFKTYGGMDELQYPRIKVLIAIAIIWFAVCVLSIRGLRGLGYSLHFSFVLQMIVCFICFIIVLSLEGVGDGLSRLVEVNYSKIKYLADIWLSIWFCVINLGLIIPSGYMTFAAYSTTSARGIGTDCIIITFFIAVYGVFMLTFFYCLAGTLANAIGCCMECVIVPGRGIYQAMIPELFSYMQSPTVLILLYYFSLFINDVIGMTMCAYGIILGFFDFFPKLQHFRLYVWIITCIFLAIVSMTIYGRVESANEWIPVTHGLYTEFIVGLCVNIEAIMLFYVYGITRLADDILFYTGKAPVKFLRVMWAVLPVLLFACNLLLWFNQHILSVYKGLMKDDEMEIRRARVNAGIFYLVIFICGFIAWFWYILIDFERRHFLLNMLKPQYHWGPPNKEARKKRKHFFPKTSIRSQAQYPRAVEDQSRKAFIQEEPSLIETVELQQIKKGKVFDDNDFFSSIGVVTSAEST